MLVVDNDIILKVHETQRLLNANLKIRCFTYRW